MHGGSGDQVILDLSIFMGLRLLHQPDIKRTELLVEIDIHIDACFEKLEIHKYFQWVLNPKVKDCVRSILHFV